MSAEKYMHRNETMRDDMETPVKTMAQTRTLSFDCSTMPSPNGMLSPTSQMFLCEIKVKNLKNGRQNRQFSKLDGEVKVETGETDITFTTCKKKEKVLMPVSDIKTFEAVDRRLMGIFKRSPAIRFTTYTGHKVALNNFSDDEQFEILTSYIKSKFVVEHSRSRYSRASTHLISSTTSNIDLKKLQQGQTLDFESPATTTPRGSFMKQEEKSPKTPRRPSLTEAVVKGLNHLVPGRDKEHREDNGEVLSTGTIPPGEIQLMQSTLVPAPPDDSVAAFPRRPDNLKQDPGAEFSIYGITVEQFFQIFWSDGAPGSFKEDDTTVNMVTKWTEEDSDKCCPRRKVAGIASTYEENSVLVPAYSAFKQEQWLTQYPDPENGCELKITCAAQTTGVPMGTHFDIVEEWSAAPISGSDGIRVNVQLSVHYLKTLTFAKALRPKIIEGGQRSVVMFARHAKAYTEQYLSNRESIKALKVLAHNPRPGARTPVPETSEQDQNTDSTATVEMTSGSYRSDAGTSSQKGEEEKDNLELWYDNKCEGIISRATSGTSNFCDVEGVVWERIEDEINPFWTFFDGLYTEINNKMNHSGSSITGHHSSITSLFPKDPPTYQPAVQTFVMSDD